MKVLLIVYGDTFNQTELKTCRTSMCYLTFFKLYLYALVRTTLRLPDNPTLRVLRNNCFFLGPKRIAVLVLHANETELSIYEKARHKNSKSRVFEVLKKVTGNRKVSILIIHGFQES